MALDATALKGLIVARVTAGVGATNLQADGLDKFAQAIAEAVVTHLTAAGVVNVTTTCGAGAGTGVGTLA